MSSYLEGIMSNNHRHPGSTTWKRVKENIILLCDSGLFERALPGSAHELYSLTTFVPNYTTPIVQSFYYGSTFQEWLKNETINKMYKTLS